MRRGGAAAAAAAPAAVVERSGGVGEAGCGRWSRRSTGRLRGAEAAAAAPGAGRDARGVGSRVSGEEAGLVAAAAREGDAMGWAWEAVGARGGAVWGDSEREGEC